MQEQYASQVRGLALTKGLDLVRIGGLDESLDHDTLYQVVVPGPNTKIFPPGRGIEGAPLSEVEDWLSHPWE